MFVFNGEGRFYFLPFFYVNNFVNSPHADKCSIDDSIIYCGTFVLWMLSNFDRTQYPIYSNLRRHRIVLKRFGDYV